ncbi:carbohydrate kinase family protein [Devriesea agamarum]|uniref:carbohydrate kinase family protein n=1 Tax=Devriesea agamarum TaxID=472569 RepID=UPI00071D6C85|nr:PfkB family carbohydrate kinase [Devriesea agamarum]
MHPLPPSPRQSTTRHEPEHDEEFCAACWSWDPLAQQRKDSDPPLDVLLSGTIFFDIVFTGLDRMPGPGEELWSKGLGSCPGGIANLATATARLGLRTGLAAGFGDDAYADWMWDTLRDQERIDLSASQRFKDFHSSLTVSMAYGGDRAMVTHGHDLPSSLTANIAQAPRAATALVDLAGDTTWWRELAHRGTRIFADIGFDETDRWDPSDLDPLEHCHAFTPNAVEAMRYTRTDSPVSAVRALSRRVPLAIVTDGVHGAYAIDQLSGEEAFCPAVAVNAIDPTGAGDVFAASIVLGTLANWPLDERLRFSALCSALAVQQFGGSLAAPGWGDISDWWRCVRDRAQAGDLDALALRAQYGFLDDIVPRHRVQGVRRAEGTFALASDAGHGAMSHGGRNC